MIVDAHQHFWEPARGGYEWFEEEGPSLRRPYLPEHLAPLMAECGVARTVLVQADGTTDETDYILTLAAETDFVAGVVGWLDFDNSSHINVLQRYLEAPKFKGLRPIIQGIADTDWMLGDEITWAYRAICDHGLTFDALGKPRHLTNFATLARRYPAMPIVLDHGLKPAIATDTPQTFQVWADGMSRLADCPNVTCKLSGLVTEAGPNWTAETLRPYTNHLLAAFGPDRLIWGSNWPVESLCGSYSDIYTTYRNLFTHLAPSDQAKIFGGNAIRAYKLDADHG